MPKRLHLTQVPIPLDEMPELRGPEAREKIEAMRNDWPQRYEVRKVVGSTAPKIHSHLSEEQVAKYCADESWQVEIT
jgi:hypothetical protein